MFTIGEFSKITGLTVKTIRFYHERGILVPALVDSENRYRNYDQRNIETARVIVQLRRFEFSLEEIGEIIGAQDESDILVNLERQKERLKERVRLQRDTVSTLEEIIRGEKEARKAMADASYQVEEK